MNLGTTQSYVDYMLLRYTALKRVRDGKKALTVGEAARMLVKHKHRSGLILGVKV